MVIYGNVLGVCALLCTFLQCLEEGCIAKTIAYHSPVVLGNPGIERWMVFVYFVIYD